MSFIKNLYKIGSPKNYIKEIARLFAQYRSIQEQPENQRFKTFLRNKNYRLLFNEITTAGKLKLTRMDDKFPFEPDGQFVTMMFTFDLALADQSGFENHAIAQFTNNQTQYHVGYPWPDNPEETPSDILSFGLQCNWFNAFGYDKMWIPFSQSNQIVYDTTTGFSVFMRIWPLTLGYHDIGTNSSPPMVNMGRRLWSKMDDLDNGAQAYLRPEGVIVFVVRKNGTEYQIRNNVAFANQTWLDCWFTFNYATNTPLLWINNVSYNTAQGDAIAWNNAHSDWIIGNWNFGNARGNFAGIVDDFRLYRNKIVTPTEVGRMWNNKLTITDITITDFVGVFIIGKSRFGPGTGTGPDGNDYVNADYVDADYIVGAPGGGGGVDSFEDASFDTGSFI